METAKLKKFAQFARRSLLEQVSAKLKLVLDKDSAARREKPKAVKELDEAIQKIGKAQVIERVAYIWFNRFCALRFMDVNRYTRIGVVSPAEGQFQPEILAEAKMGHIDDEMVHDKVRQQIFALLDGKAPSRDPQGEAYRLLVVAACNFWNKAMPFLFQRIDDYTELLMPDDLLSGNSILAYTREAMTPDACEDVEVIGWLYQFYISEKKDEVFDGLKKNKKITPENIPAATQLFTPHWIVRYLVENSLGRLWMLNRPNSRLKERMDYYIEPEEDLTTKNTNDTKENQEKDFRDFRAFRGSKNLLAVNSPEKDLTTKDTQDINHERHENKNQEKFRDFRAFRAFRGSKEDFLVVNSPEEIKICDPACGSGHMLTYAFDLLYAIYEEEGYEPAEIPEKILTNNLYGIEIDERAGELAAFALTMKARAKQRRFFNKGVKPNICVLEKVDFDEGELKNYMDFVGRDLFTAPLQTTLRQFEEADNFGSLIRPELTDVTWIHKTIEEKNVSGQLFLTLTHQKVLQALRQADYLSPKYHVVIANPPYMGAKSMTSRLKKWAESHYPNSKYDLFSMFIDRCLTLARESGAVSMITMQSWMFLSTYENLRNVILDSGSIVSMAHLGPRAFDSIGGEVVSTTAFVIKKGITETLGTFVDLREGKNEAEKSDLLIQDRYSKSYRAKVEDFKKIPCSPIAYWANENVLRAFSDGQSVSDIALPKQGLSTCNNDLFLRQWHETSLSNIAFNCKNRNDALLSGKKWFPYNKGGTFRKWYGNNEYILNWKEDGKDIHNYSDLPLDYNGAPVRGKNFYFKMGMTWSSFAGIFSGRLSPFGFAFDAKGPVLFSTDDSYSINWLMACFNSKAAMHFLKILAPTLDFNQGPIGRMPLPISRTHAGSQIDRLIDLEKYDWDSFEASWDFTNLPLLNPDYRQPTLKATYQKLRAHWREMTLEMQRLEEENNRIFIDAYGLQDELTPEVPLNEITLTCNPHYRYGNDKSEDELEALLLADTMRELVSYAVGCMFGRYALDKPGLILANQGETIDDYYEKIFNHEKHEPHEKENQEKFRDFRAFRGSCLFPADDDNVIPMLDGDWFTDDIAERFRKFLRVAFGGEHYEANLKFVERALNIKGKRNYSIRDYFLGEFYTDHVKRYKKRPIYWLFSSPKGSFNALIYMHRYRPDTVSMVLNEYLREFKTKLTAHKNHLEAVSISASARPAEKTAAIKEIEKLNKILAELDEWEREVLYPLAASRIEIDLDDGVKVNYPKFGGALKKVPGLSE